MMCNQKPFSWVHQFAENVVGKAAVFFSLGNPLHGDGEVSYADCTIHSWAHEDCLVISKVWTARISRAESSLPAPVRASFHMHAYLWGDC